MPKKPNIGEIMGDVNIAQLAPPLHISPEEFTELLLQHGSSAELRRAIQCPCVRIETRSASIDCRSCHGVGWFYPEKLRDDILVLDTSRSATLKWAAAGMMAQGTVNLTFPCDYIPGVGDLVLPSNEFHVVTEALVQEGTRRVDDALLRPERGAPGQRKQRQVSRKERLIYTGEVCIEAVYFFDKNREVQEAFPSLDFTLGPSNEWRWNEGKGPPPGHAWTVRYRAPACYMVDGSAPLFRRENDEAVPYRVTASRLDRIDPEDLR